MILRILAYHSTLYTTGPSLKAVTFPPIDESHDPVIWQGNSVAWYLDSLPFLLLFRVVFCASIAHCNSRLQQEQNEGILAA